MKISEFETLPAPGISSSKNIPGSNICLVLLPVLFLLPPFWSLLLVGLFIRKYHLEGSTAATALLAAAAAFCMIYITPIWDNIAHFGVWNTYTYYNVTSEYSEVWSIVSWYEKAKILMIEYLGEDVPYMYFVFMVYFFVVFVLYRFAYHQAPEDTNGCFLAIIASTGFFPLFGYSRNAMSLLLVCLPILCSKHKLWWGILCIWLACKFHDSSLIFAPVLLLYFLLEKKKISCDCGFYLLFVGTVVAVVNLLPQAFTLLGGLLPIEKITKYLTREGWFLYGSDYIYIPVGFAWILFLIVNIFRYHKDIKNNYLLAIFLFSSALYLASLIGGQYTLRIRFEFITVWVGMLLIYPVTRFRFSLPGMRLFKTALCISIAGYIVLAGKPIFYEPWFEDQELCRTICKRIFYYPSWMLLDVNSYGFKNDIMETSTWVK